MDLTPLSEAFYLLAGEFVTGRDPIAISGLVHKGEPYVSNLEGIKKDRLFKKPAETFLNRVLSKVFDVPSEIIPEAMDAINEVKENIDVATSIY